MDEKTNNQENKTEKASLLKQLAEWYHKRYGLPQEFRKQMARSTARKAFFVMLPLMIFSGLKLALDDTVVGVVSREIYFGGLFMLSLVGILYAMLVIYRPQLSEWIQEGLSVYALCVAIALSVYNTFTSTQMINGFLVLSIVGVLILTLVNIDPIVFSLLLVVPAVVMLNEYRVVYGKDLFMDVLILFIAFVVLAFTVRRSTAKNLRQELSLIETSKNARAADRAKSTFLARMSHEIRSPINAVLGLDEMIIRESQESQIRDYAIDIKNSGNTLLSVINDILDFSKIESGKLELFPEEYHLASLTKELDNMVLGKAMEKQLKIERFIDPYCPQTLYGDAVRIKQIILNLLTNAIKYTDEGEVAVEIDFKKLNEKYAEFYVSVRDTGRGIKPEDMTTLFEPFERLEEAKNAHIEGTGLGITICKQLLEMMGSKLEVDSTFGKGSAFSFTLVQEVRDWTPVGNIEIGRLNHSAEHEYHVSFVAPEAKILAVDDMPINLLVFSSLLKDTKMRIDQAYSGRECLRMAGQEHYDIVFLDHMMPDMDGVETLRRLRTNPDLDYRDVPIIVLTANAVTGMKERYLKDGFTDYLAKPILPEELEQMIIYYLPKELVTVTEAGRAAAGRSSFIAADNINDDYEPEGIREEDKTELTRAFERLQKIPDLKALEASAAIGGKSIYVEAAREFCETIDYRADRIEHFFREGAIGDYTIEVHALKSAARMVGAFDLSEYAKVLEQCGNNGDMEIIMLETEGLIQDYRALKPKMQEALTVEKPKELLPITKEELDEAVLAIREAMEAFDFDLAQSVMNKLAECDLPEDFRNTYGRLKVLMAEVARDDIIELLKVEE